MDKGKKIMGVLIVAAFWLFFLGGNADTAWAQEENAVMIADVIYGSSSVSFRPKISYSSLTLSVSRPNGTVFQQTFSSGSMPYFQLSGELIDGTYTYELRLLEAGKRKVREEPSQPGKLGDESKKSFFDKYEGSRKPAIQTGHFLVENGRIVTTNSTEYDPKSTVQDVLHYDDVIITGSLAVGFDSANGESFGYDTIRLKENNLRLKFMDTSIGTFPTNDWQIVINDTTSGGASYFAIQDVDAGVNPFKIEAGAPANSLYVEDYGRVGLGTSIPYVELHIVDGDSPTIRLDQDGSSGWMAQRWDLCGNETNFFIRDVTNGSKLCFRIQPNTPSNTLCLKSDGSVGIGTWSPGYPMELETTGKNAAFVCDRTDGARNFMSATADYGQFGTVSNHPTRILVNSTWKMLINSNNSLEMASGATCTTTGVWTNNSSIKYKENIKDLTSEEAVDALNELNPVKFNYKVDKEDEYVGFIAEDVPDLVATKDRKGMSSMDVVAVLTKVVKEQQKTIDELQNNIIKEQQKTIDDLRKRIEELEKTNKTKK